MGRPTYKKDEEYLLEVKISSKWLKKFRLEAGLSRKELAAALKVHVDTVSGWEQGAALPMNHRKYQICDVLHCDYFDIWKPLGCNTPSPTKGNNTP